MNMKNAKWKEDFSAIAEDSGAITSRVHTKAYLRHLFHVKELLGAQIATLQNLSFFLWLVNTAREKILEGTFSEWKEATLKEITRRL